MEEVLERPLLFLDFLKNHGLMDLCVIVKALNFEKSYEVVKSCREQCRVGCKDKRYVVEYKEAGRYERANYEDRDTEKAVELFSYIGGFMGLWLSISLVSLFDLVQTMFSLFLYPMLRISRKNKVHSM
nr:uncharacterized protein LOC107451434 [Parasteatoda tepidariorum]